MMLTPEQRPTLTISESGVVLTETYDGNEVPAEYSFAIVNDYVHAHGRHFEELQCLALGMASHIDAQQARIAGLEQDAARYRGLVDWLTGMNLLQHLECQPGAGMKVAPYWVMRKPAQVWGDSCLGYGESADAAIDAAMQKDKTT